MSGKNPNPSSVGSDQALERFESLAWEPDALPSGVDLEQLDQLQEESRLEEIGIHNRAMARRAGLRNPKKQRRMVTLKQQKRNRNRSRRRR